MRAKFINEAIRHLAPRSEEEILQNAIEMGGIDTTFNEFMEINFDTLEANIVIQYDGWDDIKRAKQHIKSWTKGQNDSLGDDIEENLFDIGYCIDYDRKMTIDDCGDCASVDFYIKKNDDE